MSSTKYYDALNLNRSSNPSEDDIKKAYKKAALKWHPDKWTSKPETEKKKAEEKFKNISEAYDILSDKEKKKGI